ncbi:uncharacterized protein LAESUDRAFT_665317 [Laetiporus sulphureus 93-53]|uniref:DNA2/NAM7 helicase-like C-terminal domain-containing protein n=1 Tax=Laetiporus sulphureus 93-53 TaxID=1314785 RepID=A0A165BDB4_9APHY|nr:uncharacterized protein LAESUDRAFT_665317 [Laetiporus sulphureus 93-53]KZT00794.1 hypothetical protein LAESUDRAFT_665317 [Laetiporus sulphureus 93-53]
MLSHPRIVLSGFTRIVPLSTVIVDEASQIELGDYLPLLGNFGSKIKKLAFIGDDKQRTFDLTSLSVALTLALSFSVAPYGQDDLGNLSSIFELAHLHKDAVFLDTQCKYLLVLVILITELQSSDRMPKPIGQFISRHVYGGQLKTCHSIISRQSCRLIDVAKGKEQKSGNSWTNVSEADAVVRIAKQLHEQGKTTRIITPYDAQRNLLESRLKAASLPWENKCFNVDSFQGNEEDHIIISIVRSEKIGFLSNMRRTNVMLTRCKKSMLICTSRAFLQHKAKASLIGKLADEWGDDAWLTWQDVLAGKF